MESPGARSRPARGRGWSRPCWGPRSCACCSTASRWPPPFPRSAGTSGSKPAQVQWVVSLYSISIGSVMLLGGRCSDAFGARRVLTGALGLCAAGGIVAGCAPSVALLLAGRVAQGSRPRPHCRRRCPSPRRCSRASPGRAGSTR